MGPKKASKARKASPSPGQREAEEGKKKNVLTEDEKKELMAQVDRKLEKKLAARQARKPSPSASPPRKKADPVASRSKAPPPTKARKGSQSPPAKPRKTDDADGLLDTFVKSV